MILTEREARALPKDDQKRVGIRLRRLPTKRRRVKP